MEAAGALRVRYLASAAFNLRLSLKEALLLTPGTYLDMIASLTQKSDDSDQSEEVD